jgi:hypothetical protein
VNTHVTGVSVTLEFQQIYSSARLRDPGQARPHGDQSAAPSKAMVLPWGAN